MPIAYHGSKSCFNTFDYSKMGQNATSEGYGFYFTSKKEIAEGYAQHGYLYTIDFQGKKSLSSTKKTITRAHLRKFIIKLDQLGQYLSNYGDTDYEGFNNVLNTTLTAEWEYSDNDVDMICSIANGYGYIETILTELYAMFGYDHIQVTAEWGNQDDIENGLYIALVNDCFKIINVEKMP